MIERSCQILFFSKFPSKGLNDNQLFKVFNLLENAPDAAAIYEKWIHSIDERLIDPSIQTYSSVNLDDPHARDELLFPLFRFNMHVIDFWLSDVVFCKELKVFEKKVFVIYSHI